MRRESLAAAIGRGVLAGVAGTAAMTSLQLAVAKARGQPVTTPVPEKWNEAPAPAQVARQLLGQRVTKQDVPLLTNVLHWLYGCSWGAAYGVIQHALRESAAPTGLAFGTGVWAASYAQLVPLGIYDPPWEYPPQELALDLSYHLVYGLGVGLAFAALVRR